MSDRDFATRLDEIEDKLGELREQVARYRSAMGGCRVAIVAGSAALVGAYTVVPVLGSTTVVVASITLVIGAMVWLGATRASKEELDAELERIEADRRGMFDQVAAHNGWVDASERGPARSCGRRN